ncbi:hypothetical protein PBI_COOPER_42 [Mycobacterium phage Cooper]|uniref:Helix-turn-helix DNA binding domain protein n=1 Tax=Mycobacterium phage Cooper TaxID=373406 RepID=Q1A074_9CAUD|nr:HTH DNA binding protein [Mycobacterium phage Cooper]ABD58159.1 hypothetical protein PBI_COOPER_42 [Mycobacterium phage Cooper]
MTTVTELPAAPQPTEHVYGLGELIRNFRLYIGLDQRSMALKLGKPRRDYQRIESGADKCPPGMLTAVENLVDEFDDNVARVIEAAEADPDRHVNIAVETGGQWEWERLVAGRAAVIVAGDPTLPRIDLTMSGNSTARERSIR